MEDPHVQRLLRSIRTALLTLVVQIDELATRYDQRPPGQAERSTLQARPGQTLRMNRGSYIVEYHDRRCFLGPTKAFRILERLSERPGEYVATDRLLDDLWTGPRTYSTVRSTVCRLKAKLRDHGMEELAGCIDGGVPGHYGLNLQDR